MKPLWSSCENVPPTPKPSICVIWLREIGIKVMDHWFFKLLHDISMATDVLTMGLSVELFVLGRDLPY